MNGSKRPGRPGKDTTTVDKSNVLKCAMGIINQEGVDALSFRVLAKKLGVTAMAVRYHVGSRDQMIADLIELAFAGVDEEPPAAQRRETPGQRLRYLLLKYCDRALERAELVRCILRDPTKMPTSLVRLTDLIRCETRTLNDGDDGDVMLNLMIDYVHGFVFAAISAPAHMTLTNEDCARSLDWLLERVERAKAT
ncbi:MAG: hypothetical protein ABJN26_13775 [Stappiaceae bacterium]